MSLIEQSVGSRPARLVGRQAARLADKIHARMAEGAPGGVWMSGSDRYRVATRRAGSASRLLIWIS